MEYTFTPQSGNSYTHMWDVASTEAFDGGFLFDKTTVPEGTTKLPKGVFLKVDFVERIATLVKTAVLYEAITLASTAVKIKKNSLLLATDTVAIGEKFVTVGAIDTSNALYDSFAITAEDLGALAIGTVLQSCDEEGTLINPDGMNYAEVLIDAEPSCNVIFKAYGIIPAALPQGVTDSIIAALKHCQFIKN